MFFSSPRISFLSVIFPDDTLARKVNTSDASVFAERYGCCPSRVWGLLWLIIAFFFFAAGVVVGLAVFKV